jgi:hypothetical protein
MIKYEDVQEHSCGDTMKSPQEMTGALSLQAIDLMKGSTGNYGGSPNGVVAQQDWEINHWG